MAELDTVAGVNKLIRTIKTLDDNGRKILLDAISVEMSEAKKQQALTLLKSQVATADKAVRDWLVDGIAKSYVYGMNFTQQQLRTMGFKPKADMPAFRAISVDFFRAAPQLTAHRTAVNAILSDAYLDFGNTMNGYVRGAEKIMNETLKRQVRSAIAAGREEGAAVREVKNIVRGQFEDRGFTVLLDRGGGRWTLDRYSEMLTRTHLIRSNNDGTMNRAGDYGVDIVEISSNNAEDELCASQEGKVYSISGKSDNYPELGDNDPPYHPNCRHTLLMRPDLD